MNNKKALIALALVALVGVVGATFAYFTSSATLNSEFTSGTYSTSVTEEFVSPDNWTPGTTTQKKVNVTNKGSVEVAVRASYTETWTSANGTTLNGVRNGERVAQFTIGSDWEKSNDGHYYYKDILGTNETSTDFISSVTFNPNFQLEEGTDIKCTTTKENGKTTINCENLATGYAGATYSLDIVIETIQADKKWEYTLTESVTPNNPQSPSTALALCKAVEPPEELIYHQECEDVCWDECWDECYDGECYEECYDREWCETCWDENGEDECPEACYEVMDGECEESCAEVCDSECEEVCEEVCDSECEYSIIPTIVGVQATKDSPYASGAAYLCDLGDGPRTFYVLKEDGDNVKLILNENLGETVSWCADSRNNSCDGDGVKTYLASQTSEWKKISQTQIILPSKDDLDLAESQPWTFANIEYIEDIEESSGYWTSTACYGYANHALLIRADGIGGCQHVAESGYAGVRPVIVIPKENMSL